MPVTELRTIPTMATAIPLRAAQSSPMTVRISGSLASRSAWGTDRSPRLAWNCFQAVRSAVLSKTAATTRTISAIKGSGTSCPWISPLTPW